MLRYSSGKILRIISMHMFKENRSGRTAYIEVISIDQGEWHLQVGIACDVHSISKDEAALAVAHSGVFVALPGPIISSPMAVRLDVSVVYSKTFPVRMKQLSEKIVEYLELGLSPWRCLN